MVDVTRQAKQRVMDAARGAIAPELEQLRCELARVADQAALVGQDSRAIRGAVAELGRRIEELQRSHDTHVPRPPGRPEFLAQYHLSDVLAWRAAEQSAQWAEQRLLNAEAHATRESHLRRAAQLAPAEGLILEFGVGDGTSLGWLEQEALGRRVIGFDSFQGLPEDWRTGFARGAFADVDRKDFARAELVDGWFQESLPPFLEANDQQIALLHVDCDLYSSTVTVLEHCVPRLAPSAVVAFDEFFNYPGWQMHEARAWQEAIERFDLLVEYVGYVPSWEQVSARLMDAPRPTPAH